jgi:hypothetical protein
MFTKLDNTQHEPHPGIPAAYSLLKEEKSLSNQSTNPKRTVLCFDVEHEREEAAVLEAFFVLFGPEPVDNYHSHLCALRRSPNIMCIVLDFHCRTIATVNLDAIGHEVFHVEKGAVLYVDLSLTGNLANHQVSLFRRLNSIACEHARRQSYTVRWGTN